MKTNNSLKLEILKEISQITDRNDILILAHNYQPPEIHEIADLIGDSLELAIAAQKAQSECILFCGVDFMAQTAKILNPDAVVLNPDPDARCIMAQMAGSATVQKMKSEFPDSTIISYVNTTAETKALSDICCTSANAVAIVDSSETDTVLFLPDRNLAAYTQRFTRKKVIPAEGFCYVHDRISRNSVASMQRLHPEALFVAHPECRPSVIDMADAVCSTSGMIRFCIDSDASSFIIGTECGMLSRMRQEIPDKKFFSVAGECAPMKRITLEKVRDCLVHRTGEITLSDDLMENARYPLERMIKVSGSK